MQVFVSHARIAARFGQIGQRPPDLLLHELVRAISQFAVCFGREGQDHVRRLFGAFERWIFPPAPGDHRMRFGVDDLVVEIRHFVFHAVRAHAVSGQWPERDELVVEVLVIALDDFQMRRRLARNRFAFAFRPVFDRRLRNLVWRIVRERIRHQVFDWVGQMAFGQLAHLLGQRTEDLPVAARLPTRRHGFRQRVYERMQIGRIQIGLLVPGRGWQHYVRIERRRVHAEVEINNQIHLAARRFAVHHDILHVTFSALVGDVVVMRAEVMLEEELVAFGARHQRVAAPDEPDARPVFGRARMFDRKPQLALFELFDRVIANLLLRLRSGARGLGDDFGIGFVELRIERQPTAAHSFCLQINRVAGSQRRLAVLRHGVIVGELALVAPLLCVDVMPRRRVLQARSRNPVFRESQRAPRSDRRELLLADVMIQTAAVLAHATAKHQRSDGRAVHQIVVIPVIDARADDHHAFAFGLRGGRSPFARELDHRVAADACPLLLPRGRIGEVGVVVILWVIARQAAAHTKLRHQQVIDRRAKNLTVLRFNPARGHAAMEDFVRTKFVNGDLRDLMIVIEEGEQRIKLRAVPRVFQFQIPFAWLIAPAMADEAARHPRFIRQRIVDEKFPLAVFFIVIPGDLAGPEQSSRFVDVSFLFEFYEQRGIRVLLDVI